MRVQKNPEDIGRCGCGRRQYCDGSHGLSEAQWQEVVAREKAEAERQAQGTAPAAPAPGGQSA